MAVPDSLAIVVVRLEEGRSGVVIVLSRSMHCWGVGWIHVGVGEFIRPARSYCELSRLFGGDYVGGERLTNRFGAQE